MTTETMTLAAYARSHGTSRQAAAKWQEAGYLVMRNKKVDVVASDAKIDVNAKGRFRVKAHGGRRTEGVRGLIDRPCLGYVAGRRVEPVAPASPPPDRWAGWHRLDNPATFAGGVMEAIRAGDEAEAIDLIDYREWEEACTQVGWDRWPMLIAAALAAELGGLDVSTVEAAVHRHVRARLAALTGRRKTSPTSGWSRASRQGTIVRAK